MWDILWYLGFPMFAVSVLGAPYKKYELDNDSEYNADQFDSIYDQRQNGTDNYKLSVDGLSLIWSPNSLLAAAALLEPALYGEYPDTSIDILLGPETGKPEEKPGAKLESDSKNIVLRHLIGAKQQIEEKDADEPKENSDDVAPTVLVISENQLTGQKSSILEKAVGSKRKLRLPELITSFLRKRSSISSPSRSGPITT